MRRLLIPLLLLIPLVLQADWNSEGSGSGTWTNEDGGTTVITTEPDGTIATKRIITYDVGFTGALDLPLTGITGAGSGSGLNADLLDGHDSSYFATSDQIGADSLPLTGGTLSGNLTLNGNLLQGSGAYTTKFSTTTVYGTATVSCGTSGSLIIESANESPYLLQLQNRTKATDLSKAFKIYQLNNGYVGIRNNGSDSDMISMNTKEVTLNADGGMVKTSSMTVYGDSTINGNLYIADGKNIVFSDANPAPTQIGEADTKIRFGYNGDWDLSMVLSPTSVETIQTETAAAALAFGTNGVERMRLGTTGMITTSSMNVIGTFTVNGEPVSATGGGTSASEFRAKDGTLRLYTQWVSTHTLVLSGYGSVNIALTDCEKVENVMITSGDDVTCSYSLWTTSFTLTNQSMSATHFNWKALGFATTPPSAYRTRAGFAVVNCTNYHDIPLFYNDTSKTYAVDNLTILTSTTSGNTATLTGKIAVADANGLVPTNISWNDYSVTSSVRLSSSSFQNNTINPGQTLMWYTNTSASMNNDITKVEVWLKEN